MWRAYQLITSTTNLLKDVWFDMLGMEGEQNRSMFPIKQLDHGRCNQNSN